MAEPIPIEDPVDELPAQVGVLRAPALALLVALAAAVTAQGAFYPEDQRLIAIPLLGAVLFTVRRIRSTVVPWSLIATGGALAAWALLAGDGVGDGAGIALLTLGVVAVVLIVASMGHAERSALTGAMVALGVVVAFSGWWGVAFHVDELALPGQGLWRASTTLTYANAAAGLIGPLALFALARATAMEGRQRTIWVLGLLMLFVGLGATLSRAGFLAFAFGVIVVLRARGLRTVFSVVVPVLCGTGIALVALGPSFREEGSARPILALVGLLVGIAATLATSSWSARRLGGLVIAGALTAGLAVVGGSGGGVLHRVVDTRLSLVSTDRSEMLDAGLEVMRTDPWTGVGPGNGRLHYRQGNGRFVEARFVHNEYLQIGIELGLVGMVLLVSMLGAMAHGVKKGAGLVHPGIAPALSPGVSVGVAAALVALVVQAGFDFLWHLPAIPLVGATLAGVSWPSKDLVASREL